MTEAPQDKTPRAGRRSGPSTTRQEVLQAAQKRFARDGFAATSIRKVAADAGVDPALVMQFYKSKDGLFASSLALSETVQSNIAAAFDAPKEAIGERLAMAFLELWEIYPDGVPLMAQLRGAASNDYAAEQLAQFVQTRLLEVIGPKLGDGPEAARRAGLALSMLMGLVLTRTMVAVPLLTEMTREDLARSVGPSIQVLLEGA